MYQKQLHVAMVSIASTGCSLGDPLSSSAIPHQLLAKIDQVLSLAHTHKLPTVTPTQVLNHLDLAYNYGRLVPHTPSMDEYGTAFKSYLDSLAEGEEDRTREELKKCEQCSGTASCYNQLMISPLDPFREGS